jgi:hypothetical protein
MSIGPALRDGAPLPGLLLFAFPAAGALVVAALYWSGRGVAADDAKAEAWRRWGTSLSIAYCAGLLLMQGLATPVPGRGRAAISAASGSSSSTGARREALGLPTGFQNLLQSHVPRVPACPAEGLWRDSGILGETLVEPASDASQVARDASGMPGRYRSDGRRPAARMRYIRSSRSLSTSG